MSRMASARAEAGSASQCQASTEKTAHLRDALVQFRRSMSHRWITRLARLPRLRHVTWMASVQPSRRAFRVIGSGSGEVEPRAGLDAGAGERPALIDGHQRGEGFAGLVLVLTACLSLGGLRKVADLGRLPASLGPDGQTGRARHEASSSNPATRGEERPSSGVAISR